MPICSDSEGACSDYEIISTSRAATLTNTGNEESGQESSSLTSAQESSSDSFENLGNLVNNLTTSMTTSATGSTASTIVTDSPSMNPLPSADDQEDIRPVRSNSLVLPPRRERRDTDRRGHKKSMEQRAESVGKKELLIALLVGSSCIVGCYLASRAGDSGEVSRLRDKLTDLEQTNHLLLTALRGEEDHLKRENHRLGVENNELKTQIEDLLLRLSDTDEKLRTAEEKLNSLEKLAEEDIPDRYGFDLPFKLCNDILQHEKLCRMFSEGLKTMARNEDDPFN